MTRSHRRGKAYGGPWYGNDGERLRFERGVKIQFLRLRGVTRRDGQWAGRSYVLELEVPHYETRRVSILFAKASPRYPDVTVDGSGDSPHRYRPEGSLCMWHPSDPPSQRWVFGDGLLPLITLTTAHLFREAYWRETGIWLGPVAPHERKQRDRDAGG